MPATLSESDTQPFSYAAGQGAPTARAATNDWYRALIDNSLNGVLLIDQQTGAILAANPEACRLLGYTEAELCALDRSMLVDMADPRLAAAMEERARTGRFRGELSYRRADGTFFPVEVANTLFKDPDGNSLASAFFTDISDRKAASAALRSSEERLREVLEHSLDASYKRNLQANTYDYMSPAFARFAGYTPEEMAALPIDAVLQLIHPDDLAPIERVIGESMTGAAGAFYEVEYRLRHKDGHYVWLEDRFAVQGDATGQPLARIGSVRNITARKETQRERNFLAAIVASSDDAIIGRTIDGVLVSWNEGAENLFGYSAAEALGQHMMFLAAPGGEPGIQHLIDQVARGEPVEALETQRKCKDGRVVDVSVTSFLVNDAQGRVIGAASIMRDISARKRLEAELRAGERKYRNLYDQSPDMYFIGLPSENRILDCNLTLARTLGYTREELVGQPSSILFTPAAFAEFLAQRTDFLSTGRYHNLELQLRRKDGAVLDVLVSGNLESDPAGGPPRANVTIHDVSERKRAEAALAESEARLRAVVENTTDRILSIDREYRLLVDNAALRTSMKPQIGYEFQPGISVFAELFSAGTMPVWQPLFDRALAGESFSVELPSVLRAGSTIEVFLNPIQDTSGTVTGATARIVDITQRLQAEREIREALQRLRLAKDAATIGIWNWEFSDNRLEWDDQLYKLYAVSPADHGNLHDTWRSRVHPDDLEFVDTTLVEAQRSGQEWHATFRIVLPDDSVRYIYSAAVTECDHSGEPIRTIGINRDVTEERLYERFLQGTNAILEERVTERTAALNSAMVELERANIVKDAFMAAISHELRTPLTGVLGIGEMLQSEVRGPLNAHQRKYVQMILDSGGRLLQTVNLVIDYTSLLAGRAALQRERCHLCELSAASIRSVQAIAQAKQQTIALNCTPLDLEIESDAQGIVKIMTTLLENAIKFTPIAGETGVDISQAAGAVSVEVWDTGIGMSEDQLAHLFEPFVQGDLSLARRFDGLGLGLAYVHKLVGMLGGSISVTSELNSGTRFRVLLPN